MFQKKRMFGLDRKSKRDVVSLKAQSHPDLPEIYGSSLKSCEKKQWIDSKTTSSVAGKPWEQSYQDIYQRQFQNQQQDGYKQGQLIQVSNPWHLVSKQADHYSDATIYLERHHYTGEMRKRTEPNLYNLY